MFWNFRKVFFKIGTRIFILKFIFILTINSKSTLFNIISIYTFLYFYKFFFTFENKETFTPTKKGKKELKNFSIFVLIIGIRVCTYSNGYNIKKQNLKSFVKLYHYVFPQ